jgi:hypothetical protein
MLRELGRPLVEDASSDVKLGAEVRIADPTAVDTAAVGCGLPLDELDGLGGIEFEAWLQPWRDRLAEQRRQALQVRAEACGGAGDADSALLWYERARTVDPLREPAALQVMRLLAARGDHGAAR